MLSFETTTPGGPLVPVESEIPQPQGSEVIVKMLACGVCHSDIHMHDGVFDLGHQKQLEVGVQVWSWVTKYSVKSLPSGQNLKALQLVIAE